MIFVNVAVAYNISVVFVCNVVILEFVVVICACISDDIFVKYPNLALDTLFIFPLTIKLLFNDVVNVNGVYNISVVLVCNVLVLLFVVVKSDVLAFWLICAYISDVIFVKYSNLA